MRTPARQVSLLVSVVVPVHNRHALAVRAVASVLNQTWRELECIAVDDGSTDGVFDALSAMRDARLTVLRQQNQGVSSARNAGIAQARGELIALLDSDDYFLPEKLAVQVPFLLENGLEICQTEEIWHRFGRRVNPGLRHAKPSGRIFERALELCCVSPSCALFTRRFWRTCGPFDAALPACEDYDLWLRAALAYEIGLAPKALTVKEGGRADQLSRKIIGLDLYRIQALVKLLRQSALSESERRLAQDALARKVRIYRRGCLLHDKPEEATRIAALAGGWGEREEKSGRIGGGTFCTSFGGESTKMKTFSALPI
ncbi:MAG: glycosyltransferase [Desulfovibrionaceae bacterium]|nr:glycosyltransferase [Desulfovibrionaceae bacterium]